MPYDIVVDVDTSALGVCRNVAFPPVDGVLAGTYNIARMKGDGGPALQGIGGELPGQRIEFDTKRGRARIVDRLRLPENAELLRRIKWQIENSDSLGRQSFSEPWKRTDCVEDRDYTLSIEPGAPGPNNRDTWLWHIARLVHHKNRMGGPTPKMVVVSGHVPTPEEVEKAATQIIWKGDRQGISSVGNNPDFNVIKPPVSS